MIDCYKNQNNDHVIYTSVVIAFRLQLAIGNGSHDGVLYLHPHQGYLIHLRLLKT